MRPQRFVAPLLSLALAASFLPPVTAPAAAQETPAGPLLNELSVNPPGNDSGYDYVEIIAPPGASLAGLSVVALAGQASQDPGSLSNVVDLSSITEVGPSGLVVVGNVPPDRFPDGVQQLPFGDQDEATEDQAGVDPNKGPSPSCVRTAASSLRLASTTTPTTMECSTPRGTPISSTPSAGWTTKTAPSTTGAAPRTASTAASPR